MIQTFKIVKGLDNIPAENFFVMNKRRNNKIYKKRCRKNTRRGFFSQRVVNNWNKLIHQNPDIIEAKTVNGFKNKYDDYVTNRKNQQQKNLRNGIGTKLLNRKRDTNANMCKK